MEKTESKIDLKKTTKTTKTRSKRVNGLGDAVEAITTATGIKAAVDWFSELTGVDCGCAARKERWNKLVQFRNADCLKEEEYLALNTFFELNPKELNVEAQDMIAKIHARVFNHEVRKPCSCSPKRWIQMINELKSVFDEYKKP
jgi:hypothetical protein